MKVWGKRSKKDWKMFEDWDTPAHRFRGTVVIEGMRVRPGEPILALCANISFRDIRDRPVTTKGGQYEIVVGGSREYPIDDGAPIRFYVNRAKAKCAWPDGEWMETVPFRAGWEAELNLMVDDARNEEGYPDMMDT